METPAVQQLRKLVESHPAEVNFGTSADAVGDEWIALAEARLGHPFSRSYLWFLRNYSGGEIGGEEIYSLYGMDFDAVSGGDIVSQHLANRNNGLLGQDKVAISETDLGEVFFFDYARFDGTECPICLRLPSGEQVDYAADFHGFLAKRIEAHLDA